MNEADTRARLIEPKLKAAGWTDQQITREFCYKRRRSPDASSLGRSFFRPRAALPEGWRWVRLGDVAKRDATLILPSTEPNRFFNIGMEQVAPGQWEEPSINPVTGARIKSSCIFSARARSLRQAEAIFKQGDTLLTGGSCQHGIRTFISSPGFGGASLPCLVFAISRFRALCQPKYDR